MRPPDRALATFDRSRLGRRKVFVVGMVSGVVLSAKWRSLAKGGIKVLLRGLSVAQRAAVRGAENVADLTHEARSELGLQDHDL